MTEATEPEVRRDREGRWFVRLYLGTDPLTGRRVRPYHALTGARDEAEARSMAAEWAAEVAPWLATGARRRLDSQLWAWVHAPARFNTDRAFEGSTVATYEGCIRNYVAWKAQIEATGLPYLPMQTLRPAFETALHWRGGIEIEKVARILGHTQPTTTLGYYDRPEGDELVRVLLEQNPDLG